MKPLTFKFIIPLLLGAPAVVPLVGAVATEGARRAVSEEILRTTGSGERQWLQVRGDVSVEALASRLRVDESGLARINNVDEDHQFRDGERVAIPTAGATPQLLLAAADPQTKQAQASGSELPSRPAVVQIGDTLLKLAQRHGLTPSDLLRLNPGLDAARLVVGTQIRVAQAVPGRTRLLLGLAPVGSGGLSWPDTPSFPEGGQPGRFDGGSGAANWVWPAKGVFTSGYGWRWGRMHKGIDVANNVGTPIVAAQSGRVTFSGWHDGGYGYLVEITHDDGSMSRYAHNSALLVREGDVVQQGQQISQMGSTGRSTGPHLHFEIHPAGRGAVNPLQYLQPRA